MRPVPSLSQVEYCSPCDNLPAMREESLQNLLQVQELWLPLLQCHHVDAEHTLQWRMLVKVVEHDVRYFTTP